MLSQVLLGQALESRRMKGMLKHKASHHGDSLISTRIDFEDTYDGLGDELDDNDDAFNDETFGSVEKTNVG
jgi:hypothetical protein